MAVLQSLERSEYAYTKWDSPECKRMIREGWKAYSVNYKGIAFMYRAIKREETLWQKIKRILTWSA